MPNSIVKYFRAFWYWWLWPLASFPWRPRIRKLLSNITASMESIHRGTHTEPLPSTESGPSLTPVTQQLPLTPDIIHQLLLSPPELRTSSLLTLRLIHTLTMPILTELFLTSFPLPLPLPPRSR
jgi:hypothetical protein